MNVKSEKLLVTMAVFPDKIKIKYPLNIRVNMQVNIQVYIQINIQ